jgi:hypothetical protein
MAQPAFDTLLVQSRDLFCERLCEAVHTQLGRANDILTALAEDTDDKERQTILIEVRDLASERRNQVEQHFRTRYLAEFQKRTQKAKKISGSLADIHLDQLELVTDDDLDETLKFKRITEKIRKSCDEELSAIDQRVRVLVNDAALESDDNPFSPQAIADGYRLACRQVEFDLAQRKVMLELFDDAMLDAIAECYQKVNDLLVQEGILPKLKYGISRSKSDKARPAKEAEKEGEKAPAEKAPATPQDMFAMIQQLLGPVAAKGGGAPGMGVGGAPLLQGADLMGSLSRLQVGDATGVTAPEGEDLAALLAAAKSGMSNVLHQLKTTSVGQGLGQVDSVTLDIVARLFDELFDDPKVPIALKGLIGRLQLPMLKVAIADKELFSTKTHPARQLLDTLGQVGLRLPADFDPSSPLFAKLEVFVQELVDGFQEKLEIFDTVRTLLLEMIDEYDANVALRMEESRKQLEQAESLAVAKAAAQEEIAKRVKASAAPRPIVEYLAQQWIKYLLILHAREGVESDGWRRALETIDQLLWSVEPKTTVEDKRKLASTIPGLLKSIRGGAMDAKIDSAVNTAFFGELMKCHTEVMQQPPPKPEKPAKTRTKEAVAAGGAASAASAPAKKPPPPPPGDDLLDFTAPVTVANPFGEGQVEVLSQDLDFTAAPAAPVPVALEASPDDSQKMTRARKPRDTIPLPSRLVEGAWVEIIGADQEKHPARLHYVSPMKSHFLFVDRKGNKVYECSRSMLKRRLDNFEVTILEGEPDASLFDRIMDSLFGKLGAKVPAPAA